MKLVPVASQDGRPFLWVNPDHISSVSRLDFEAGDLIQLRAELKVEGMPLQRIDIGTFSSPRLADTAWQDFLAQFNG